MAPNDILLCFLVSFLDHLWKILLLCLVLFTHDTLKRISNYLTVKIGLFLLWFFSNEALINKKMWKTDFTLQQSNIVRHCIFSLHHVLPIICLQNSHTVTKSHQDLLASVSELLFSGYHLFAPHQRAFTSVQTKWTIRGNELWVTTNTHSVKALLI